MKNTLPVLTAAQTYACDGYTIRALGVPSRTLMERAARRASEIFISRTDLFPSGDVLLLCGSGNNGGDGFAMARFLSDGSLGAVRRAAVLYTGREGPDGLPDLSRMSEECARQYRLARDAGVRVTLLSDVDPSDPAALLSCLAGREGEDGTPTVSVSVSIADAVFGIGLDRPVTGRIGVLFDTIRAAGWPVLAVDVPSGVIADTGSVPGACLPAAATAAMQVFKPGHVLYPGADMAGALYAADLGISLDPVTGAGAGGADPVTMYLSGTDLLSDVLPPRARRSNKGTYGRLGLVCGCAGMCGAALLAASAALRAGVGLAQIVTPEENRVPVQTALPEAILTVYDGHDPQPQELLRRFVTPEALSGAGGGRDAADGWVVGCGLGTSQASVTVLKTLLDAPAGSAAPAPLVLDADALNILSARPYLWSSRRLSEPGRMVVITPHPAEMARLSGLSVRAVLDDLPGTARAFASEHGVTVVLKDAHTVTAAPDGTVYVCAAGNAGMAKGGSGDALAGIIGAILTQNRARLADGSLTPARAAAAGVLLHALAGDAAAARLGEYAMLPSDLIASLCDVTHGLSDSRTRAEEV